MSAKQAPVQQRIAVTVTAADFATEYDAERTFPFYEDENGEGVYGFGHLDASEFAEAVTEYDRYCGAAADVEPYIGEDVMFGWAVAFESPDAPGEWAWSRDGVTSETEGAFPVMWVNR